MKSRNRSRRSTRNLYFPVADGVWGSKDVFVNFYFVRSAGTNEWVLVDCGLPSSHTRIFAIAAELFGEDYPPAAILLTHGHFDHRGAIQKLLERWDVPVYAHPLEAPYLTGRSAYPPADPSVGGGLMASASWMYPTKPIDLGTRLQTLPEDGSVPELPGWTYLHTPGHSPGHISFFREADRVLLAGDAFVTTRQESALSVMRQEPYLSGPPKYFTSDWRAAESSVAALAALEPAVAATGHGRPLRGAYLGEALHALARSFRYLAIPQRGRYVAQPARAGQDGLEYVPPRPAPSRESVAIVVGLLLLSAGVALLLDRRKKKAQR